MVLIPIECPHCKSVDVSKFGKSSAGNKRYRCNNSDCKRTFQKEYTYNACDPFSEIRSKVFSKNHDLHRIVVTLVINFWFFGRILA